MSDLMSKELHDDVVKLLASKDAEIERLTAENHKYHVNINGLQTELDDLTAENERIEKEAACAAHNADKYHDIIREQRAKVERLSSQLSYVCAEIERDHELGRLSIDSEDAAKSGRAALQESDDG